MRELWTLLFLHLLLQSGLFMGSKAQAMTNRRIKMDYYVISLDSLNQLEDLPAELDTFCHVTLLVWNREAEMVVFYGAGAYVSMKDRHKPITSWSATKGFSSNNGSRIFPSWQDRGFNMLGRELTAVYFENPEFVIVSGGSIVGLDPTILRTVAKHRKFELKLIPCQDCDPGIYNSSLGHWTGLLGTLESQAADMAVGGFGVSLEYFQVADFVPIPIFITSASITFYAAPPSVHTSWYGFLDPLDWKTWICLAVSITAFLLVAKLAYWKTNSAFEFASSIINAFSAMGYNNLPTLVASHYILLTTLTLPGLVMNLAYSTSLMSSLAAPHDGKTAESWEQLLREDYKFVFRKGSFAQSMFQDSTETNPNYARIYERVLAQNPKATFFEYIDTIGVQNQVLSNKKTVLIGDDSDSLIMESDINGTELLRKSKMADYNIYPSEPIRKNYPYYDPIFIDIMWLRDSGASAGIDMYALIEAGLFIQNQRVYIKNHYKSHEEKPTPLKLNVLYGAFYLLIAGITFATLVFALYDNFFRVK